MNIKLIINGESKTIVTLQSPSGSTAQQVTHIKVTDRGDAALGWNALYASLVAQARRDGLVDNDDVIGWVCGRMTELEWIEGVHPDVITSDDLQYLLANLSKLAHPMLKDVTLADDLDIDPILDELGEKGWDLGESDTPADEPDPSYAESFFVDATQAMREGSYQGWWSPIERETLSIGAPGGPGKVEPIGVLPDEDEGTAVAGDWVESGIGVGHRVIYLGQERILDWLPGANSSHYRVWDYDRFASRGNPLTNLLLENDWDTISQTHEVVWLGRNLGDNPNSVNDLILNWLPSTGDYRLYRVDLVGTKEDGTPDVLPEPPVATNKWTTIRISKKLIYLGGNRVLDWEPASGKIRIWVLDRAATGSTDPLSKLEVEWTWETIRDGQRVINLGGDRVLTWEPSTRWYRVWRYDRTIRDGDPFPNPPLVEGHWDDIDETHELIWLGGRQVLDWRPESSEYRIRLFDRTVVSANPLK